jgi:hypothetical protein
LPIWPAYSNTDNEVQYLGGPITAGEVANIDRLNILEAVYTTVRTEAFAAR